MPLENDESTTIDRLPRCTIPLTPAVFSSVIGFLDLCLGFGGGLAALSLGRVGGGLTGGCVTGGLGLGRCPEGLDEISTLEV
jgi:hypothetical protein